MKHYYRFIINYDEDETRIFISPKELKKGAVAVVHSYGEQFAIATVLEPVSELEALTGYQRKCLEDVICTVDVTEYLVKQKAISERSKPEELMDEKMAELKYEDQLKKTADRSADFKVLYEAYLKTLSPVTDDVQETLDGE